MLIDFTVSKVGKDRSLKKFGGSGLCGYRAVLKFHFGTPDGSLPKIVNTPNASHGIILR